MIRPALAIAIVSLSSLASAAWADTENVRKAQAQLQFRNVAAANNASGGSSVPRAPAPMPTDKQEIFRSLDIDGDGRVSKAEAAGHASVTLGFDRADRNRDGKLSFAEFDSIGKPRPARKKSTASASAGATKKPKAN